MVWRREVSGLADEGIIISGAGSIRVGPLLSGLVRDSGGSKGRQQCNDCSQACDCNPNRIAKEDLLDLNVCYNYIQ